MMEPREHAILIEMFALQTFLLKSLITVLESRGVLESDDLSAYVSLNFSSDDSNRRLRRSVSQKYINIATNYGLRLEIPDSSEAES